MNMLSFIHIVQLLFILNRYVMTLYIVLGSQTNYKGPPNCGHDLFLLLQQI